MPKYSRNLRKDDNDWKEWFIPFLFVIVLLRLIITFIRPYQIDMSGYLAWSKYLAENGPATLYSGSGYHIVYAPFYQYFLLITGWVARVLKLTSVLHVFLIKLWSVMFEIIGAWLILLLAKKYNRTRAGALAALLYVFNPGVFMNSSIWGQFDPIPATMLLGCICLFEYKKPNLGALLFLVSVLTKPQSGLLVLIVLYLYFRDFRLDGESFKRLAIGLLSGVAVYLAIVMPFYSPTPLAGTGVPYLLDPFYWLLELYTRSLQDYPFATANGFNLWTLAGGQVQPDSNPFLGLTYAGWGFMLLVCAVIYIGYLMVKSKGSFQSVIYGSFLTLFSAFMFMTKMHERYLLPAIIFCTLAAVWQKKHIPIAALVSVSVFLNQLVLYIISFQKIYWLDRWDLSALIVAALTLFTYIWAMIQGYLLYVRPNSHKTLKNGG